MLFQMRERTGEMMSAKISTCDYFKVHSSKPTVTQLFVKHKSHCVLLFVCLEVSIFGFLMYQDKQAESD